MSAETDRPDDEKIYMAEVIRGAAEATAKSLSFFFFRQIWHWLALALLVPLTWALAAPVLGGGSWLGISDLWWFWASVALAILHQVFVWAGWRGQLGWQWFTRRFGDRDMTAWAAAFFPFLIGRPVFVLFLGLADLGSMDLPPVMCFIMGVIFASPSIYTLWSINCYFGFWRAMGGDHFRESYRNMPLVHDGIFAWSSNAMYVFGVMGLLAIALFCGSVAALAAALFQQAYIWVHYYCTEKPDMELLYG